MAALLVVINGENHEQTLENIMGNMIIEIATLRRIYPNY
jgi:hypothetical protein